MRALSIIPGLLLVLAACGPKLPPRYVVEKDVGKYRYSRYQQVLDVEIPIEGNPAVGHTATYVKGGDQIHVTPAFVTVYEKARGLTETARKRLRDMTGYTLLTRELSGEYVWQVKGEGGDTWLIWVSGKHLVKLGIPEGKTQVPEDLLEAYLDYYPSDLDEKGRAQSDAESRGDALEPKSETAP